MAKSKKAPTKKTVAKKPKKEKRDWRDEIKMMLLQMRKELLQEVTQTMRAESDHLKFDIGDFYDHASTDRDRELTLMLADREREKLTLVDDALKRIETGTYGICESRGHAVHQAMPVLPGRSGKEITSPASGAASGG